MSVHEADIAGVLHHDPPPVLARDHLDIDGVGIVRRPHPHVAVTSAGADHGDESHRPDQELIVVQAWRGGDQVGDG